MAFTDYTSPDSVRAVLGISAKEVEDSVVTQNVYLIAMLEALRSISQTLAADYSTLKAATGTKTTDQTRFLLLAESICSYTVAVALIPSLPLAAPQLITDGKSQQGRIANPYEKLLPSLNASLGLFLPKLQEAYAKLYPAYTAPAKKNRTTVLAVGVGVDPITGV